MQLSIEERRRIRERYARQQVTQKQLADDFQVSLSTVSRILKCPEENLHRRPGSGNPGKIHERERQCLVRFAEQNPEARLHEYAKELERECGVRVSLQTIGVHLKRLKLPAKKAAFALAGSSRTKSHRSALRAGAEANSQRSRTQGNRERRHAHEPNVAAEADLMLGYSKGNNYPERVESPRLRPAPSASACMSQTA
jgi:transposase